MYNDNALAHYGVLGMRWGVHRSRGSGKSATARKADIKSANAKKQSSASDAKKSLKDMSDDEIRSMISRFELEKKYKDLSKGEEQKKTSRGKEFVLDVLEKSGKNIATQATTYAMGQLVNKVFKSDVVNPKKGQKDK